MPIYEYKCDVCGMETELEQKLKDPDPICHGDGGTCKDEYCQVFFHEPCTMKKQISKTGFSLKGSGWARDKYGK